MMASVDMSHAYKADRIHEQDRTFLRFIWEGKVYEYTYLPIGISCAPRIFTKIIKPVFSFFSLFFLKIKWGFRALCILMILFWLVIKG